jgi:hypothetical protein
MIVISRVLSRTLCALALAGFGVTSAAFAQSPTPGHAYPSISGEKVRGIQELNNSGQIGTATLTEQPGSTTHVIVTIKPPPAKTENVEIYRSIDATCKNLVAKPDFVLSPLTGGTSSTIVKLSRERLLSGNYSLLVRSGDRHVACGHLETE